MPDFQPLRIIIVGAGLGGLAAAFCFARDGHHVDLYERRPIFEPRGGSIMLRPTATRYLRQWGLEANFESVATPSAGTKYYNAHTGDLIFHRQGSPATMGGHPDLQTLRRETQIIFHDRAKAAGARLHFGVTISDVGEDATRAWITLETGVRIDADVVFAADGVLSRLRPKIIPGAPEPIVGWTTLHQVHAKGDEVLANKDARDLAKSNDLAVYMPRSGGGYVVASYNRKIGRHSGIFGIPEAAGADERMWDEHGNLEYVRDYFKDYHPKLKALLNVVSSCDRWRLAEMPDLPQWVSKHGRLVLLGDSAHAMYPDAAMGFSTIVEDVATLSYLLKDHQRKGVPALTNIWQEVRIPRVNRIKAWASFNQTLYTKGSSSPKQGTKSQEATTASLENVEPDRNADFRSSAFVKWAFGYDAIAGVKKHMGDESSVTHL